MFDVKIIEETMKGMSEMIKATKMGKKWVWIRQVKGPTITFSEAFKFCASSKVNFLSLQLYSPKIPSLQKMQSSETSIGSKNVKSNKRNGCFDNSHL